MRYRIDGRGFVVLGLATLAGLIVGAMSATALEGGDGPGAAPTTATTGSPTTSSPDTTPTEAPHATDESTTTVHSETATTSPTTTEPPTTTTTTIPKPDDEILADALPSLAAVEGVGCRLGTVATGFVDAEGRLVTSPALAVAGHWAAAFDASGQPLGPFAADGAGDHYSWSATAYGLAMLPADFGGLPEPGDEVIVVGWLDAAATAPTAVPATVDSATGGEARISPAGRVETTALGSPVFLRDGRFAGVVAEVRSGQVTVRPLPGTLSRSGGQDACRAVAGGIAPERYTDLRDPELQAFLLAQVLASALADDDWDTVRAMDPVRRTFTTEDFEEGWGALDVSTLVPIRVSRLDAATYDWRVGLVAHETEGSSRVTRLFCVTWRAHLDSGMVDQTGRDGLSGNFGASGYVPDLDPQGGWVDPTSLIGLLERTC